MSNIGKHMTDGEYETYRTWLQQFSKQHRSTVTNRLIEALRGRCAGGDIIDCVLEDIRCRECKRNAWYNQKDKYNIMILKAIQHDEQAAGEVFEIVYMAIQMRAQGCELRSKPQDKPPTDKQLAYLKRLGCNKIPQTLKHASFLISQMLGHQK